MGKNEKIRKKYIYNSYFLKIMDMKNEQDLHFPKNIVIIDFVSAPVGLSLMNELKNFVSETSYICQYKNLLI